MLSSPRKEGRLGEFDSSTRLSVARKREESSASSSVQSRSSDMLVAWAWPACACLSMVSESQDQQRPGPAAIRTRVKNGTPFRNTNDAPRAVFITVLYRTEISCSATVQYSNALSRSCSFIQLVEV